MLPFVVLVLAVLYLVLDRAGVIGELADAVRQRLGETNDSPPTRPDPDATDPEIDRRLEVFQNFIEQLKPPDDEE